MASGSNKFLFQFPYTPVLRTFPHPHPTQSLSSAQQSKLCLVSGQFENGCVVRMGETDEGGSAIQERQLCRKSNVRLYRRQGQGKSQTERHATFQGGMIPTWGQLNRSRERHTEEMHRTGNAQPVNKNNKV